MNIDQSTADFITLATYLSIYPIITADVSLKALQTGKKTKMS